VRCRRIFRDLTGGFKCFHRRVLEKTDLNDVHADGYGFQIELTYRAIQAGFTVREIPIRFRERREGHSKMTARIVPGRDCAAAPLSLMSTPPSIAEWLRRPA